MESYLIYIAKSALAAAAFYLVYLLLFQNRKQFVFNRIYLPASLVLSFIIPLITFTTIEYIEPVPATNFNGFANLAAAPGVAETPGMVWQWYHYLLAIYILAGFGFLVLLLFGHIKALNIVKYSRLKMLFGTEINVSARDIHPFSFFSKIVLSEKTLNSPDLRIIVDHENVHVKEHHTLDILFTEILFLFQWFNPFAWLIKDAVKNNLEYKTDHEVTKIHNAKDYQMAMVALADKKGVAPFLTALNGSQLKNRIIMMKQKTENRYAFLKQLIILPLLAILVMGLSNKEVKTEVIQKENQTEKYQFSDDTGFRSIVINVNGQIIPTDDSRLKSLNLSKSFDSGEIIKLLGIDQNKVTATTFSIKEKSENSIIYIRTSDYIPGTDSEFEKVTDNSDKKPVTSSSSENYYAINNKLVDKDEFLKEGKEGFGKLVILMGTDASEKYGENVSGIVADAETSEFAKSSIQNKLTIVENAKQDTVPLIVEEMPKFPGGELALRKYIASGIIYPVIAMENGIQGEVYVAFVIDKSGNVTDAHISKGVDPSLDREALRVINSLPKWKPGKQRGKAVNVPYTVPVSFTITATQMLENTPLYIVDGKELADIKSIDSGDIASVDVLKGESATSLYGEKGKNGAILITTKASESRPELDFKVEEMPQFPGGEPALRKYIASHIKYPEIAIEKGIHGKVYVSFVIDKRGDVTGAKIARGVDPSLDKEALRVVNSLPKWKPGKQRGKAVNVPYTVPVSFVFTAEHIKKYSKLELDPQFKVPLYIVNGKEVEDIETINPEDIENIEVLKGGAATSFYGEKGRNGIILIATKKEKPFDTSDKLVIVDGKEFKGDINDISPADIVSVEVIKSRPDNNIYDGKGPEKDKIIIQTKTKYNTTKITTPLELRKYIAQRVRYPEKASVENAVGVITILVEFDNFGNVFQSSEKPKGKYLALDEIVISAPKNNDKKPVSRDSETVKLLNDEAMRVINNLPKIDIEEFKGKSVAIVVRFVLQ